MGSGKYIKRVVNKYPLNVFIKEILFDFDNFEDMNTNEIAETLRISQQAVSGRLQRAREKLRRMLDSAERSERNG